MIKLFFRDQLPLIFLNLVQMATILFILWVSGFDDLSLIFYSLFLSFFFLTLYLIYRFITLKKFYERLTRPVTDLDEMFEKLDGAPVTTALSNLLKEQHRLYRNEIDRSESKKEEHVTFINQWVHQMKTPLSIIELIIQDEDEEEIASIRDETEKLEKGIEMVLYAARLEVFEKDFQVEPVSLEKIMQKVLSENKRLFIKNKVYPKMELTTETVESDGKWLIFILNQLITNAIKYSKGKGENIFITDHESQEGIELQIRDQGIGIPKTDMKRVFDPFFTGENGRLYRESTGMGLSLVKEVCDKLGHGLKIESEQGEGTTVTITFRR